MIIHEVKPVSVDFASYQADGAYSASDLKLLLSQCPKALWHSNCLLYTSDAADE